MDRVVGSTEADIVVLTVLAEEYNAVLACLQDPRMLPGSADQPNTYVWQLGTLLPRQYPGAFSIVVGKGTQTSSYGALATRQAIQLFKPKYVVFVGVAGGLAPEGQQRGDVAVSDVVVSYEYGKIGASGLEARSDFTYRCDDALVRAADVATAQTWWSVDAAGLRAPKARVGMVGSGDKVIDNPDDTFFAAIVAKWPKLLAVEMEGSGVAAAIHDAQSERKAVGFLLVRGISDMPGTQAGGTDQRDGGKQLAARHAAQFFAHLVATAWPVPPASGTRSDRSRPAGAPPHSTSRSGPSSASPQHLTPREISNPGPWRYLLDHWAPRCHSWLRRVGVVGTPDEYNDIAGCMREIKAELEQSIADRTKTYVPSQARTIPRAPYASDDGADQFVRPIHRVIRAILGRSEGGDGASAELALVNRQSRVVNDIARTLRDADEPLILLGDPGMGKSMTLQRVACSSVERELNRVYPALTLYVPLGEFHVAGQVSPRDVLDYVRSSVPPRLAPWIDALARAGRLILLFDGMDEMSRERYTEHTEALSVFAGSQATEMRTLFSCRITDFSPRFTHRRYVLVPFDRPQILRYLRDYFRPERIIMIEGEAWSMQRLAKRLAQRDLAIDATNPFILWLLCHHLSTAKRWPTSRVELLHSFLEKTYERKQTQLRRAPQPTALPTHADCERAFAELAFMITERNLGRAIAIADWFAHAESATEVLAMLPAGRTLGVLVQSTDLAYVRFEHHRLQEYFTALYLSRIQREVAWLDKLDLPRWQETMINLVLLGGGDVAIQALAAALIEPVEAFRAAMEAYEAARPEEAAVPDDQAAKHQAAEHQAAEHQAAEHQAAEHQAAEHQAAEHQAAEADAAALAAPEPPSGQQEGELVEDGDPAPAIALASSVEPEFSLSDEMLLGDRIELAARILRDTAQPISSTTECLLPALRSAVAFLMERGNPITQVKMMRASMHLADPDLLAAARAPLTSPIKWVRSQALMLLAESPQGRGVNLATEIGLDLARGELLANLRSYVRAIVRSRQPGAALSLAIALILGCLQIAVAAGLAAAVYWGAREPHINAHVFFSALGPPSPILFGLALVGGLCAAQLREGGRHRALFVVGTVPVLLALEYFGPAVLHGDALEMVVGVLYTSFGLAGLIPAYPVIWAAQFIILAPVAAAYCALTRTTRRDDQTLSVLLLIEIWRSHRPQPLRILLCEIAAVAYFGAWALSPVLGKVILILPLTSFGIFALFVIGRDLHRWLRRGAIPSVKRMVWGAARIVFFALALFAFMFALQWIGEVAGPFLKPHETQISQGFIALIGAILSLWVAARTLSIYRRLRPTVFPPRSFTPAYWQARIRAMRATNQAEWIVRTDHQSLGCTPSQFLEVLSAIASHIKKEPALSAYWQHRAELEQVLKQERQG